jgi:transcriptional regulator of NAD metabolism
MKGDARRRELVELLLSAETPIAGAVLARQLGVSRQIIVQDIAVLKAAGYEILSTHYGYVIQKTPLVERVFKVRHSSEETADELSCIVALGGTVVDVFVRHKIYGKIEAPLNIFSDNHVDQFIERIRSGKSSELMSITGGYHYHTVRADSEAVLSKITEALEKKGYLITDR